MADWFETRFRQPVDTGQPDPAFVARMRSLVVEEWEAHAGTIPSADMDPHDREGDLIMLETEDRPPLGDAPTPSRRPRGRWLLAAAAVAVVAVIGALLAASGDDEEKIDTAPVAPTTQQPQDIMGLQDSEDFLEPGSYFIDPDGDPATPLRVTYDVAAEGWSAWIGAAKSQDDGHVLLSIMAVTNLVREGCHGHDPADPPVGPTVDDLATALSQLAPFEVTSPPTDVTMFGYRGKHLQLTVPDIPNSSDQFLGCADNGKLRSWFAPPNFDGSFYGYNAEPGRSEDFWILEVQGTRLVIVKNSAPSSPPQVVAELGAIFDSIRIEP